MASSAKDGKFVVSVTLADGTTFSYDTTHLVDIDNNYAVITDPPSDATKDFEILSQAAKSLNQQGNFFARVTYGLSDQAIAADLKSILLTKPIKITWLNDPSYKLYFVSVIEGTSILGTADVEGTPGGGFEVGGFRYYNGSQPLRSAAQIWPAMDRNSAARAFQMFAPGYSVQSPSNLERVKFPSRPFGGSYSFFWHARGTSSPYYVRADGTVFRAPEARVQGLVTSRPGTVVQLQEVGKYGGN